MPYDPINGTDPTVLLTIGVCVSGSAFPGGIFGFVGSVCAQAAPLGRQHKGATGTGGPSWLELRARPGDPSAGPGLEVSNADHISQLASIDPFSPRRVRPAHTPREETGPCGSRNRPGAPFEVGPRRDRTPPPARGQARDRECDEEALWLGKLAGLRARGDLRQRPQSREGRDQRLGPRPASRESQPHPPARAHQAPGDAQQALAHPLGLGEGAHRPGRAGPPRRSRAWASRKTPSVSLVVVEGGEGDLAHPGLLGDADRVLDAGPAAVAQLKGGDVLIALIGDEGGVAIAGLAA